MKTATQTRPRIETPRPAEKPPERDFSHRARWKRPPINELDQSTRDFIARFPNENTMENRRDLLLAALDLSYNVFHAIETSARCYSEDRDRAAARAVKDDAAYEIVLGLLWNTSNPCEDPTSDEDWTDIAYGIIKTAMDYTKARAGSAPYPAFLCEWWVDNKVVPPEMEYLVDGSPRKSQCGSLLADQVVKPGPSAALLARDAELWGDDDEDDDDDSEGGDDE